MRCMDWGQAFWTILCFVKFYKTYQYETGQSTPWCMATMGRHHIINAKQYHAKLVKHVIVYAFIDAIVFIYTFHFMLKSSFWALKFKTFWWSDPSDKWWKVTFSIQFRVPNFWIKDFSTQFLCFSVAIVEIFAGMRATPYIVFHMYIGCEQKQQM